MSPPPPTPTLFPYTTLFRSAGTSNHRSSPNSWNTDAATIMLTLSAGSVPERRASSVELFDVELAFGVARSQHRSEEHTSELQSLRHLVCRLLLEKKKNNKQT